MTSFNDKRLAFCILAAATLLIGIGAFVGFTYNRFALARLTCFEAQKRESTRSQESGRAHVHYTEFGTRSGLVEKTRLQAIRKKTVGEDVTALNHSLLADDYPLPLAALGLNPELKLSDEQLRIMQTLGEEFLDTLGQTSPLPKGNSNRVDLHEIDRWQAAQQINDERFRNLFGDEVFNAQQVYRAQIEQSLQVGSGS